MLTRPPPLQLQYDNLSGVRPVQQQQVLLPPSHPKIKSFITDIYKTDWRNFVIGVTIINALRFFVSASNAFQDAGIDSSYHAPKLAQISTALGAMYLTTAVIEIFGILSVSLQRLTLIRVYAHLAFISALLITVAGFVAAVAYFLLAEDLVRECVALSVAGSLRSKSLFRGKHLHGALPSTKVAQAQCIKAWSNSSVSQVFAVFAFSLIPAALYFLLAYTYYRQASDPSHPANLCRRSTSHGSNHVLMQELYPNARYSPLYGGGSATAASRDITDVYGGGARARTPRRGTGVFGKGTQQQRTMGTKGVKKEGNKLVKKAAVMLQLSPIMRTATSPYGLTPGPPSFAGPSRDYRPAFLSIRSDDGMVRYV